MREAIERARALGETIARHERTLAFLAAQQALEHDADARRLLDAYQQQAERIHQLELARQPVEAVDKHKLRELQSEMAGNGAIKDFIRRQADYVDLMNTVNRTMEETIASARQSGD